MDATKPLLYGIVFSLVPAGLNGRYQAFQDRTTRANSAAGPLVARLKLRRLPLNPVAVARVAGVDVTTDTALKQTIAFLGRTVDEVCTKTPG